MNGTKDIQLINSTLVIPNRMKRNKKKIIEFIMLTTQQQDHLEKCQNVCKQQFLSVSSFYSSFILLCSCLCIIPLYILNMKKNK